MLEAIACFMLKDQAVLVRGGPDDSLVRVRRGEAEADERPFRELMAI